MITVMDLRAGNLCEFDGTLYRVVTYQHVKPGKGGGVRQAQDQECRIRNRHRQDPGQLGKGG